MWHVTIEDKRGIKTVFAIDRERSVDAARDAMAAFAVRHPEFRDGEDCWVHMVAPKRAAIDIEGAPI